MTSSWTVSYRKWANNSNCHTLWLVQNWWQNSFWLHLKILFFIVSLIASFVKSLLSFGIGIQLTQWTFIGQFCISVFSSFPHWFLLRNASFLVAFIPSCNNVSITNASLISRICAFNLANILTDLWIGLSPFMCSQIIITN